MVFKRVISNFFQQIHSEIIKSRHLFWSLFRLDSDSFWEKAIKLCIYTLLLAPGIEHLDSMKGRSRQNFDLYCQEFRCPSHMVIIRQLDHHLPFGGAWCFWSWIWPHLSPANLKIGSYLAFSPMYLHSLKTKDWLNLVVTKFNAGMLGNFC